MALKNIVLFEHYDGVRFILEKSLVKYHRFVNILSSCCKKQAKKFIDQKDIDLIITELNSIDSAGLEISRYARDVKPDMKIIWITVLKCGIFKEIKEELGDVHCIEKPLEIKYFRRDVIKTLDLDI